MISRHFSFLVVAMSAFLIVSCSEPTVYEEFVKCSSRDSLGRYAFSLDMSDSTASYDIYFYTRIERGKTEKRRTSAQEQPYSWKLASEDTPIEVLMVSPDGKQYCETVYIGKEACVESSYYYKVYDALYRRNTVPVSYGLWKMYLSVPQEIEGLCGMGVKMERFSEKHGKR